MSGGGGNTESKAQNKLARISREQWKDYQTRYVPVEDKIIDYVNDRPGARAESIARSDAYVDSAFDSAGEINSRRASRYGGMTAEQRSKFDQKVSLGRSAAKVGGQNETRSRVNDRMLNLESDMVNVGTGIRSEAVQGFGTSASLESRRNSTNLALASENEAGQVGLAAMGAGAALAFAI